MPAGDQELLDGVLRDVSRSFYRTLRVLPGPVRPQISLAYLLARTSDTIADSGSVPPERRLAALGSFRQRVAGQSDGPLALNEFRDSGASPGEQVLLQRVEESLAVLASFAQADRALIIRVLNTIIGGQEQDLLRFAPEPGHAGNSLKALETPEELDDYTYMVAGCVGEFWTRICRVHLFPTAALDEPSMISDGIRFGKGLQLVNILRDIPSDLRQGRCYIPSAQLAAIGLKPVDLLDSKNSHRFKPVHDDWLNRAEEHLRAGWRYTNSLPWRHMRVRLACAWPVLIGLETLKCLRTGNVLDSTARIKVSRSAVKRIILRSTLLYPVPTIWRRQAAHF